MNCVVYDVNMNKPKPFTQTYATEKEALAKVMQLTKMDKSELLIKTKSRTEPILDSIRRFKLLEGPFHDYQAADLESAGNWRRDGSLDVIYLAPGLHVFSLLGKEEPHSAKIHAALSKLSISKQHQAPRMSGTESEQYKAGEIMRGGLGTATTSWFKTDAKKRKLWVQQNLGVSQHSSLITALTNAQIIQIDNEMGTFSWKDSEDDSATFYSMRDYDAAAFRAMQHIHKLGSLLRLAMSDYTNTLDGMLKVKRLAERTFIAAGLQSFVDLEYKFSWLFRAMYLSEMSARGDTQLQLKNDMGMAAMEEVLQPDRALWLKTWCAHFKVKTLKRSSRN